jgi:hypothetical protein
MNDSEAITQEFQRTERHEYVHSIAEDDDYNCMHGNCGQPRNAECHAPAEPPRCPGCEHEPHTTSCPYCHCVDAYIPATVSPAPQRGYVRRKCSICGEGLGFTEDDPCDNCADNQPPAATPSRDDEAVAADIIRSIAPSQFDGKSRFIEVEKQSLVQKLANALATTPTTHDEQAARDVANAIIETIKAKRDEWQRLADEKKDAPYQPDSLLAHVSAANEILTALEHP